MMNNFKKHTKRLVIKSIILSLVLSSWLIINRNDEFPIDRESKDVEVANYLK